MPNQGGRNSLVQPRTGGLDGGDGMGEPLLGDFNQHQQQMPNMMNQNQMYRGGQGGYGMQGGYQQPNMMMGGG